VLHHVPGAHARAASGTVDRQQLDFGVGRVPDGHGKGFHAVGTGLQRDALVAELAQVLDIQHELLAHAVDRREVRVPETAVPGERLDGALCESLLNGRVFGVGVDQVAALLQEQGVVEAGDLDLAADVLGALAPLELDADPVAVLADDVFGNAVAGVLDVELDDDRAVAVVIAHVGLDPAVELRGRGDPAIFQHGILVHADHVLADDDRDAAQGAAHSKGVPVLGGNEGRPERSGHQRDAHLRLLARAEGGLQADVGEQAVVGISGEALGAVIVPLDAQGMVPHSDLGRVPAPGRDHAEIPWIEHMPPLQAREPCLAFAHAIRPAQCAQTGFGRCAPVDGPKHVVAL
jgi:hypothetical protein